VSVRAPCLGIGFRRGSPRAPWAPPVASGRFAFLEMSDRDARRRVPTPSVDGHARFDLARELVAEFVPPSKVDIAAMALVSLRAAHPSRTITRTEVLERMRVSYPEAAV
jgi:hypothetical protein